GLYAWLASLGDQWEQLLVRALPSQHMEYWLADARLPHGAAPAWRLWTPAATLLRGPMFRLLDMAAWTRRGVAAAASLAVGLDIRDTQIDENHGSWLLSLDGARATCARSAHADTADMMLRMDIATLSPLFVGALSATAALAAGLLTCDRPDRLHELDAALALPETWTFDRF
ncbi:MAG TPA: sterol carrier protein domain-containing protein, partial [Longimicrobiales bacterium]|nr:sterol carrier protein domain-containing protein [Longimicrobiales bacterium]